MNKVGPRSRGTVGRSRGREIQGWLAMHDPESESVATERGAGRVGEESGAPGRSQGRGTIIRSDRGGRPTRSAEPPPLPHRKVLACWPDDWRERWGRRANALEDGGLTWRDAEGRAFLEVWTQWRRRAEVVGRN